MPLLNVRPRSRTRGRLLFALAVVALLTAIVWMLLTIGNPFPPSTLAMATGPEGSGYREIGLRYQEVFRRAGVELRLEPTAGGFENLQRLRDPGSGISVAFVESGVTQRQESPELRSLGAVTLEPLWIFVRGRSAGSVAERLAGKRLSIGPEGSGTRVVARKLLALNGVPESAVELLADTPDRAAEALLRGDLDVAMMLTSWQSPVVRKLLVADGVVLEGFPRADAYVALFPSLSKVILPQGVADLARDIPPRDVPLLAIESNLVVRRELHPALQYLLLEAASEIHGGHEIFQSAGRFPAPGTLDLPLTDQALTFYRSGRPFVYRYLPYWVAGLAERLILVIIPLFAVIFPIAHFAPMLFAYVTERRIFGFYRELKLVERELERPETEIELDQLDAVLEELDRRTNRLWVPLSFSQRLFILKSHVALAREQVERRRSTTAPRSA